MLVFFSANPTVHLFQNGPAFLRVSLTYYDLVAIFFMALVSAFFIASTVTTAVALSREDRAAARAKALQEKASRLQRLREERAARKAAVRAAKAAVTSAPTVPRGTASPSNIEIDQ
jgi:hypothetical protein